MVIVIGLSIKTPQKQGLPLKSRGCLLKAFTSGGARLKKDTGVVQLSTRLRISPCPYAEQAHNRDASVPSSGL